MSAPFQNPRQHGFLVNGPGSAFSELLLGLYERMYAFEASGGPSRYLPAFSVSNPQSVFRTIQNYIITLIPYFLDPDSMHTVGGRTLQNYTTTSFFLAAGMGAGFRRVTSYSGFGDPTPAGYGVAVGGDILGWWVWEDIITALSNLNYTTVDTTLTQTGGGYPSLIRQAYAFSPSDMATAWNAASYSDPGGSILYIHAFRLNYSHWGQQVIHAQSGYVTSVIPRTPSVAPPGADLVIWSKCSALTIPEYFYPYFPGPIGYWSPLDSWTQDAYNPGQSLIYTPGATSIPFTNRVLDAYFTSGPSSPLVSMLLDSPGPDIAQGCWVGSIGVFEWAYTNSGV